MVYEHRNYMRSVKVTFDDFLGRFTSVSEPVKVFFVFSCCVDFFVFVLPLQSFCSFLERRMGLSF